MRLKLQFGMSYSREIRWKQQVTDFPHRVTYGGSKWEFVMWADDTTKQVDYICHFSEVSMYSSGWYLTYENIDDLLSMYETESCQCGAKLLGHPGHSHWCNSFGR